MQIESKIVEACKLHEINIIDLDIDLGLLEQEGLHCMYKRGQDFEETAHGAEIVYLRMCKAIKKRYKKGIIRIMDSTQDNINESIGKLKTELIEATKNEIK